MSVIDEIKSALPKMQKELPDDIKVAFEFDQSPYVTRAIDSLWNEGLLGGLALAVGILVDEATVEIENIHTQFHHANSVERGGTRQDWCRRSACGR